MWRGEGERARARRLSSTVEAPARMTRRQAAITRATGRSCSICACSPPEYLLYRRSSKRFCGGASGLAETNAAFMSSPWHTRTGSTRGHEISAHRHQIKYESLLPSMPVQASFPRTIIDPLHHMSDNVQIQRRSCCSLPHQKPNAHDKPDGAAATTRKGNRSLGRIKSGVIQV